MGSINTNSALRTQTLQNQSVKQNQKQPAFKAMIKCRNIEEVNCLNRPINAPSSQNSQGIWYIFTGNQQDEFMSKVEKTIGPEIAELFNNKQARCNIPLENYKKLSLAKEATTDSMEMKYQSQPGKIISAKEHAQNCMKALTDFFSL